MIHKDKNQFSDVLNVAAQRTGFRVNLLEKDYYLTLMLSGGTPKTTVEDYWGGDIPFFTPTDTKDNFYVISTGKQITDQGLSNCNSRLYPKDIVFITARGTVGNVVLAGQDMAMNQSCYALVGHKGIDQYFVFLAVKSQVEYLKRNTGGATFDTIVVDTFKRMKMIRPATEQIEFFRVIIAPFFNEMLILTNKNRVLRESRDMLLPKLISGEIDVSKMDIVMQEKINLLDRGDAYGNRKMEN